MEERYSRSSIFYPRILTTGLVQNLASGACRFVLRESRRSLFRELAVAGRSYFAEQAADDIARG